MEEKLKSGLEITGVLRILWNIHHTVAAGRRVGHERTITSQLTSESLG